jgi:hypothetical protein
MHAILNHLHQMIGQDLHIPWPPGSPSPAPAPVPYVTQHILMGSGATAQFAPTGQTQGGAFTMLAGTDIGPFIPHIGAPSTTLPAEIAVSFSKSLFVIGNYQVSGRPVAAAMAGQTNMNLNCGTPLPTPTGNVIAVSTHVAGMAPPAVAVAVGGMVGGMVGGSALGQVKGPTLDASTAYALEKLTAQAQKRLLHKALVNDGTKGGSAGDRYRAAEWDPATPAAMDEAEPGVAGLLADEPAGVGPAALGMDPPPTEEGEEPSPPGGEAAVATYLDDPGIEEFPSGG